MRICFLIAGTLLLTGACNTTEKKEPPDFLAADLDTAVSPGADFFDYANGGWLKRNPIPADHSSWGIGQMVDLDIYNRLRTINEKAAAEQAAPGSTAQKIGDFWKSGMDSAGIEKQGLTPLEPDLIRIGKIASVRDLIQVAADLHRKGVQVLLADEISQDEKYSDQMAYHLGQGGLGMPDRDYYFNTDEKTVQVRKSYRHYLFNAFRTLGKDSSEAMKAAEGVYQLETRLAKASRKIAALRDPDSNYHKMGIGPLQKLCFRIDWKDYLKNTGIASIDSLIVGQPEFLEALNRELFQTPLEVWKNYLAFHLLNHSAYYLDTQIYMDRFNYTRAITGVEIPRPRWKRVLDAEQDAIGEALGQLFVKEYFPEKARQRYRDLVESIRNAYKERIRKLTWMSDSTRQNALYKLSRITEKVGYPDKWRDFSALRIDQGPYVLNAQRAAEWWHNDMIKKLGKPVDRTEWDVTPQTYNAFYNPSNNEIVLPAGIFIVPG
ncbi:MAG TPA: M13 family metallopeptidase, partial [Puia sp.]